MLILRRLLFIRFFITLVRVKRQQSKLGDLSNGNLMLVKMKGLLVICHADVPVVIHNHICLCDKFTRLPV